MIYPPLAGPAGADPVPAPRPRRPACSPAPRSAPRCSAPPKPVEIIASLLPAPVKWRLFFRRQAAQPQVPPRRRRHRGWRGHRRRRDRPRHAAHHRPVGAMNPPPAACAAARPIRHGHQRRPPAGRALTSSGRNRHARRAVPVAVVFAALGAVKILALPPMRVRAAHLGFSVAAYRAIGTLEIAGAAGVVLGVAAPVIGGLAARRAAAPARRCPRRPPPQRRLAAPRGTCGGGRTTGRGLPRRPVSERPHERSRDHRRRRADGTDRRDPARPERRRVPRAGALGVGLPAASRRPPRRRDLPRPCPTRPRRRARRHLPSLPRAPPRSTGTCGCWPSSGATPTGAGTASPRRTCSTSPIWNGCCATTSAGTPPPPFGATSRSPP